MPGFRRPFPSRKWLKLSLAEAQREAGYNKMVADNVTRESLDAERELVVLRAQAATQAATIGQQDEELEAARLRIAFLEREMTNLTSSTHNWAEDIASLRRELEAAETAAVTAHKRADEWDALSNRVKDRLDVELKRHFKTRAKLARAHRLIRTLWASRRRWQDQVWEAADPVRAQSRNGEAVVLDFFGGDRVTVLGERAEWSRWQ